MNQSHDDRIAERPINLCAAYGCPLFGVASTSTSGATGDWWCCCHFGQEVGRIQRITAELSRQPLLVRAVNAIRGAFGKPKPEWQQIARMVVQELTVDQRADLCPLAGESGRAWMVRIENELLAICRPVMQAAVQTSLVPHEDSSSWGKVAFTIPEFA